MVHMYRSEDNSMELVLPSQLYMSFREQIQVARLLQHAHLPTQDILLFLFIFKIGFLI